MHCLSNFYMQKHHIQHKFKQIVIYLDMALIITTLKQNCRLQYNSIVINVTGHISNSEWFRFHKVNLFKATTHF